MFMDQELTWPMFQNCSPCSRALGIHDGNILIGTVFEIGRLG